MATICACGCGRELPPRTGPGRPPKYLAEHAPDKRQGRRDRSKPVPSIAPVVSMPQPVHAEPALVTATRSELEKAGQAGTPEGLIVLTLAAQISAGGGTQAGLAALVREFHASKARALDGATDAGDVVAGIFGT